MAKMRGFWAKKRLFRLPGRRGCAAVGAGLLLMLASQAGAADLEEAQKLYKTGDYGACIVLGEKALGGEELGSEWWVVKTQAELASGKYEDALKSFRRGNEIYDNLQLDLA